MPCAIPVCRRTLCVIRKLEFLSIWRKLSLIGCSVRTCLESRQPSHLSSFEDSFSCFCNCSLYTCGISIALTIRSLDPRWGLDAWGFGVSIHLQDLYGISIAFPNRSLDHSLFARLIPFGAFRGWCAGDVLSHSLSTRLIARYKLYFSNRFLEYISARRDYVIISMAVPKTFEMRLVIHMEQGHRELCVRNPWIVHLYFHINCIYFHVERNGQ